LKLIKVNFLLTYLHVVIDTVNDSTTMCD